MYSSPPCQVLDHSIPWCRWHRHCKQQATRWPSLARAFCPTVEATGFRCFPTGFDWLLSDREPVYARVQELVAQRETPFSPLADMYAGFLPAQMISDLLSLARSWSPDVLVRDPVEFAGCIAAECLGMPHAACGRSLRSGKGPASHAR